MLDADLRKRIEDAVDEGFDDQIAFTQELVRIPSTRGVEAPAQDLMAEGFREHGYDVDRFKIDPEIIREHPGASPIAISYENAWTVVGSWRPERPRGRSLVFNGHVDVVPEGPHDMWTDPPYAAVIKDGWMYGRGAGDMKSGTASYLYAMAALRRAGVMPSGTVHMESVIEEECTGNGALSCLTRGYTGDICVIPEPTGERLTKAQVGVVWMQVEVRGIPVHVAVAGEGQNAIEACVPIWRKLHELEATWNLDAAKHPEFKDVDHPINVVISKIKGGDWTSSVPAWCTFDVRVGLYPDTEVSEIQRQLEEAVAEASRGHPFLANNPPRLSWHGFTSKGYVLTGDDDARPLLEAAHAAVRGEGTTLDLRATTALTDARFHGLYGNTPSLVYGPRCEKAHGFDERVEIESIRRVTKTLALFAADWCGVESI